jgi:hypothetical protein
MSEVPFCRDCRHRIPDYLGIEWADCRLAVRQPPTVDPVSGKEEPTTYGSCSTERILNGVGHCGPTGRFFEVGPR